jgi:hypothetical protein
MTLLFIIYFIGFSFHFLQVNWLCESFHIHIVQGSLVGGCGLSGFTQVYLDKELARASSCLLLTFYVVW